MIYVALDPGTTTGVAFYDTGLQEFGALEIHGRHELYDYLGDEWGLGIGWVKGAPYPDVVIIERWDVRRNTHQLSNQDDPRYIIGAVEAVCYLQQVTYREQTPAEAKSFGTNDKLRALGWYEGGEGHADDAARHLLVALVKDRVPEILEAIT